MRIVKVDATNSTNLLAKEINTNNSYENFCISAEYQTNGRGQLSSKWESEKAKNLTFTIVYNNLQLHVRHQFILNAFICMGIYKVLEPYQIGNLFLKWPNDILADRKKICGILIENALSGSLINTSYVGVGLNVNQKNFQNLPNASSLINILKREVDRDKLLEELISEFKKIPYQIHHLEPHAIIKKYKSRLYRFNLQSDFLIKNRHNTGIIKDVDSDGRLSVALANGDLQKFQHKEITQII
jgi:BirA family biotin operon repressor/biotin-[acetyl-CoA-carboxylase] ligase